VSKAHRLLAKAVAKCRFTRVPGFLLDSINQYLVGRPRKLSVELDQQTFGPCPDPESQQSNKGEQSMARGE